MTDPLSIAAAVTGFVALSGYIYDKVKTRLSNWKTWYTDYISLKSVAGDLRSTLGDLQSQMKKTKSSSSRLGREENSQFKQIVYEGEGTLQRVDNFIGKYEDMEYSKSKRLKYVSSGKKELEGYVSRMKDMISVIQTKLSLTKLVASSLYSPSSVRSAALSLLASQSGSSSVKKWSASVSNYAESMSSDLSILPDSYEDKCTELVSLREKLEQKVKRHGLEHECPLRTMSEMVEHLYDHRLLCPARDLGRLCLGLQKRVLGSGHPDTLKTKRRLERVESACR